MARGPRLTAVDLNENRAFSRWRRPFGQTENAKYAGKGTGTLHTVNNFDKPIEMELFGGTALAIAYTSDAKAVRGADFTVISTNWASPWLALATYPLPKGMPPCPPGGCLCSWNWLHTAGNVRPDAEGRPRGEGYATEIYNVLLRCQVTGATDAGNVIPRGAVPTPCDGDVAAGGGELTNCTTGPKAPMYLWQADGNNMAVPTPAPRGWKAPSYNWRYGFSDGAQQDAVVRKGAEAGANRKGRVENKPRADALETGRGGLAIVNARGEALNPYPLAPPVLDVLKADGVVLGTANASSDGAVAATSAEAGAASEPEALKASEGANATGANATGAHATGGNTTQVTSSTSNSTGPAEVAAEHPGKGDLNVHLAGDGAPPSPSPSAVASPLASGLEPSPAATPAAEAEADPSPSPSPDAATGENGSAGAHDSTHGAHGKGGKSGNVKCARRRRRHMARH